MENNYIVIRINNILLSGLKKFPNLGEKRKKMRFAKKKTLKNMSNNDQNNKINTLIK